MGLLSQCSWLPLQAWGLPLLRPCLEGRRNHPPQGQEPGLQAQGPPEQAPKSSRPPTAATPPTRLTLDPSRLNWTQSINKLLGFRDCLLPEHH